ncbi:MAG TPA: HNH endonuclease signature motif containing protein [Ilumatobacteraceae bacterium]|nr:HNH endonuclease signature motif containing protein [Ilumatobacteraceae bacterium]
MASNTSTEGSASWPSAAALQADQAAKELSERVAEIVGRLNLAYAELVQVIAEADATEAWAGPGLRSLEHWLAWQAGVSNATAKQLHQVSDALTTHPKITSLFQDGLLTLDQTAAAVMVLPDYDQHLADLVPKATVAQIRTAARCARPPRERSQDDPPTYQDQLNFFRDDDGWMHGDFRLGPDRGETFRNALNEARDRMYTDGSTNVSWSDVLIEILEQSLSSQPSDRARRYDTFLFVDPTQPIQGRWADGITVNIGLQQLFTCDGWIHPVIVDNGVPVSVGRAQRTVPERTRRLVHHRDNGVCQVPWCNRSRGLEVHHITHWEHLGPTETWNLLLICRHCHRAVHLGEFQIIGNADRPQTLQFLGPTGYPIRRPSPKLDPAPNWKRPTTPYQHPIGERIDWLWFDLPPPQAS